MIVPIDNTASALIEEDRRHICGGISLTAHEFAEKLQTSMRYTREQGWTCERCDRHEQAMQVAGHVEDEPADAEPTHGPSPLLNAYPMWSAMQALRNRIR